MLSTLGLLCKPVVVVLTNCLCQDITAQISSQPEKNEYTLNHLQTHLVIVFQKRQSQIKKDRLSQEKRIGNQHICVFLACWRKKFSFQLFSLWAKGNTGLDWKSAHPLLLNTREPVYCTLLCLGLQSKQWNYEQGSLIIALHRVNPSL